MNSTDEVFLCLLLAAVLGLILFLRTKFPGASRAAQTAVLLVATILFFSICNLFLPSPGAGVHSLSESRAGMIQR